MRPIHRHPRRRKWRIAKKMGFEAVVLQMNWNLVGDHDRVDKRVDYYLRHMEHVQDRLYLGLVLLFPLRGRSPAVDRVTGYVR